MKHSTKFFTVLGLVLLLSLTVVGIASADVLTGKGWLHAEGAGVAVLRMTGEVEIRGHGVGIVYIYGAEIIHAEGKGRRSDLPGGGIIFRGHEGTINVKGERMVIRMIGDKIEFTAHGKGTALLRGRGHYKTKHHSGDWAPNGLTLEVVEE